MLTREDRIKIFVLYLVFAVFIVVGLLVILDQHWRRQDDNDRLRIQIEQEMARCGDAWPSC